VGGGPQIRSFYEGQPYSQFFAFDKDKRFGANVSSHDLTGDGQEEIIVAAEKGEEPWIQIFDIKGNYKTKFLAYDKTMKQGVKVSSGDVNNDGQDEIVTVPQAGYKPVVRIYNQTGKLWGEFMALNQFFKGGLNVAIGDVNADNFEEIIISSGAGSQSYVKIFNYHGQLVRQFLAYNNFFGGLNVALGDVDADGSLEIVTAPANKLEPRIKIFDNEGRLQKNFLAYDKKFFGGVNLALGDVNGDGRDEIITGPGPGLGPEVKIFNTSGGLLSQIVAYHPKFKGGVKVSAGK
ncbi:MAG TPA: VCBS repeat-containing protein, partial [Patescibacteria group bacterium]|nr:VCBS repeat-containing protein [Patescibacteria group bacterium]